MKKIPEFMTEDDEWFEKKPRRKREERAKRPSLTPDDFFGEGEEPGYAVRLIDIAIGITLIILLYLVFGSYFKL